MNSSPENVVVRFAPSPTGYLHIGSARTALFNYLFAQQHKGKFILRIEDTDTMRSSKEYEDDILNGLTWLSIVYDELYRQSERSNVYTKYIEKMVMDGTAYISKEEKGDRNEVIRFKNTNETITFQDIIRGDISFDTTDLGDFVLAKSITEPLYHLAVVVDDSEMGVTHIIRGEDGISNTPRQILIQRAIGAVKPLYAHIPLILAEDKSKLSKRHGAVSISEYKENGYLPEAMINFLALIGWHPDNDREIFSIEELVQKFTLEKVQKGGAVFNKEKLDWINKSYISKIDMSKLAVQIKNALPDDIRNLPSYSDEIMDRLTPTILERINVFGDIKNMIQNGELVYYFKQPKYEAVKLSWKEDDADKTVEHLAHISQLAHAIDFSTIENIREVIMPYANEEGRGSVLWPMRFALSGKERSPDPFTLAFILGKEETIERLKVAERMLRGLLTA